MYTIVHIRAFSFYFLFRKKKKKKIAIIHEPMKGFSIFWIGLFCISREKIPFIANFYFLLNLKAEIFSNKKETSNHLIFYRFLSKDKKKKNKK